MGDVLHTYTKHIPAHACAIHVPYMCQASTIHLTFPALSQVWNMPGIMYGMGMGMYGNWMIGICATMYMLVYMQPMVYLNF